MFATPGPLDFVALARDIRTFWEREEVFARLVAKNRGGPRFSFLDGPITANNPLGVHHAWGRTLKDLVQRHRAMRGFDQRYQNGFDCQGLWVEVEVEKSLGFNSKHEIEAFGLDRFSRACRDRVLHFARIQTEQSKALGQWMDWPVSYYTMADANIEYIWHFLEQCHARGWIDAGHRVMPWCPRCGTSISQHEMLDSYTELVHPSAVAALPLAGQEDTWLLVWTTTPWTLPANVALAVHPDLVYEEVAADGRRFCLAADARRHFPRLRDVRRRMKGADLVGLAYTGPFDELPAQRGVEHRVVPWEDVSAADGTGIVHVAPGCGQEDFELGRRHGLATVAPVDENGVYFEGFGPLSGTSTAGAAHTVLAALHAKGLLFSQAPHRHRYPTCWRCGQELIFRLVDEWFVRVDELRPLILEANAAVNWQPEYMRLRMHDWLSTMGDWCISRKRFWGLPLPFYPCRGCGRLTVVSSRRALRARAVDPQRVDTLPELHRPWIDQVLITCPACGRPVARVEEVGDCWLDAGIVPFSTLAYLEDRPHWKRWFPADVVVEMMAQLRGWFYSLLVMSVTLVGRAPYRTVVAHERVLGADGREMHKSWGNAIWFDEAVEKMGADVIRYLFASQPIAEPVRFGSEAAREVKRKFLVLWNVYRLFTTYAAIDRPSLDSGLVPPAGTRGLERWLLSRLQKVAREVGSSLDAVQARRAVLTLEAFIHEDLSHWYVRRRRRHFWKGEMDDDKQLAYRTLHHALVRLCQLLAPVVPFLAEDVYQNLVARRAPDAPRSVHLTAYPEPDPTLEDRELEAGVAMVRRVLNVGLSARNTARVTGRRPLARAIVRVPESMRRWIEEFRVDLADELNVEALEVRGPQEAPEMDGATGVWVWATDRDVVVALDTRVTPELWQKGVARAVVRHVQDLRKRRGLRVNDRIRLTIAAPPALAAAIDEHRQHVCAETLAVSLALGEGLPDTTLEEAAIDGVTVRLGLARA